MSVTPSPQRWVVCASCGEIVEESADPDVQRRYHLPTCPEQPALRVRRLQPGGDPPAEITFRPDPGDMAAEPGEPGAVWLTDEAAPPEEPDQEPEEPGRHRVPGRQLIRAASRAVPRNRERKAVAALLVAISVFALVAYLVSGRPAEADRPSGALAPPIPTRPASTARPSAAARPTVSRSASATRPAGTAPGPSQQQPPPPSATCATSAALGNCGPFYGYPQVNGTTAVTGISIGNNVWNPVSGWSQTLDATDPGHWSVTANMPAGNTTVVSYPTVAADYVQSSSTSVPLSDYASVYSSFTETMNATSKTSAWATYDISIGQGGGTSSVADVMIENDFANSGGCSGGATATFGGSGGVPVQSWHLCQYGTELAWMLTGGSEQSGTVDVLGMLRWLVSHGYLAEDAGLFKISYGWQICSTGGQNETFGVSRFSISTTRS